MKSQEEIYLGWCYVRRESTPPKKQNRIKYMYIKKKKRTKKVVSHCFPQQKHPSQKGPEGINAGAVSGEDQDLPEEGRAPRVQEPGEEPGLSARTGRAKRLWLARRPPGAAVFVLVRRRGAPFGKWRCSLYTTKPFLLLILLSLVFGVCVCVHSKPQGNRFCVFFLSRGSPKKYKHPAVIYNIICACFLVVL